MQLQCAATQIKLLKLAHYSLCASYETSCTSWWLFHCSACRRRAGSVQVMRLPARRRHAEQWNSHHIIRFCQISRWISNHIQFRLVFRNFNWCVRSRSHIGTIDWYQNWLNHKCAKQYVIFMYTYLQCSVTSGRVHVHIYAVVFCYASYRSCSRPIAYCT